MLGDPGRNRVKNRSRVSALIAFQVRPETLALLLPVHNLLFTEVLYRRNEHITYNRRPELVRCGRPGGRVAGRAYPMAGNLHCVVIEPGILIMVLLARRQSLVLPPQMHRVPFANQRLNVPPRFECGYALFPWVLPGRRRG